MKIYTKKGDSGKTSLFSGELVEKNHPRLQAYGSLDELNSQLGFLISQLSEKEEIQSQLQTIQNDLFYLGAWLATMPESRNIPLLKEISENQITVLEDAIDEMQSLLPPMHTFILPGGHPTAAIAHLARTICRRVERNIQPLCQPTERETYDINMAKIQTYLNRLSDYLFVMARYLNFLYKREDIIWK